MAGAISQALDEVLNGEVRSSLQIQRRIGKVDEALGISDEAPRVLNAAVADTVSRRVLDLREPLIAEQEYNFILDVGPQWDKVRSFVTGSKEFPEHALPPTEDGFLIHVVLISDDFKPGLSSAWIWVPRFRGRSYPYDITRRQKAERSGPITLPITAPALFDSAQTALQAHGRLCLYYRNNLIQSASVSLGVARTKDEVLEADHSVNVDFALSGSFQNVERLARRGVWFTPTDDGAGVPVALNLTMNSDGSGSHRIIVHHQLDMMPDGSAPPAGSYFTPPQPPPPPAGWVRYRPEAAEDLLKQSRDELLTCFFKRDADGRRTNYDGLDAKTNGKPRAQFIADLQALAILGNLIYNHFITRIRAEDKAVDAADWAQLISKSLATASVIQVARTEDATYAFPWALVYEYPMDDSKAYTNCPILKEWGEDGVRRGLRLMKFCPYGDEEYHQGNIYCPYGFWGLKHIIEQPLSEWHDNNGLVERGETENEILYRAHVDMAVGTTRAVKDTERLKAHLEKLKKLPNVNITRPEFAEDINRVLQAIRQPSIVYLFCHGKFDQVERIAYLNIGSLDEKQYRIYPHTVSNWVNAKNLDAWKERRPLVFINGCHTVDLSPNQIVSFVTSFQYARARGVMGTEIFIQAPVAYEVAEQLFDKLINQKMPVGVAMYQIRWELANKGNLLGLAYTLHSVADLHFKESA